METVVSQMKNTKSCLKQTQSVRAVHTNGVEPPAWRVVRSIWVVRLFFIGGWNPPYIEQLLRFVLFSYAKS